MHKFTPPATWAAAALTAIGVLCSAPDAAEAATADKPNIIFIISDDHRWDALGIAGNDNIKTPNLDKMANEGQWYREATIHTSLCTVSRATILTGVPPHIHGWYSNNTQRKDVLDNAALMEKQNELPRELINAGYHTAFAGKWHLIPNPVDLGFETVKRWMVGGAGRYRDPVLADGASTDRLAAKGFTQTIFADDAIEIINEHVDANTTKPLFLWASFTAPHSPFGPNPKPISGMYDNKSAKELVPKTFHDDPDKAQNADTSWRKYYEAISALDAEVGRLLDTVRNSEMSTNTVVFFLGDNGFMMGERGLRGKSVPYEGSIRVPLIVWGPESIVGTKGTTVTASVNSLDLPPTFAKLAGATPPADWAGRDFTPVMKDGKDHNFTWAVSTYVLDKADEGGTPAYRMIRTPNHKLIQYDPSTNRPNELYNLRADAGEKTNLIGKAEVSSVQADLEKKLAEFRKKTGDNSWDAKGPLVSMRERNREANDAEEESAEEAARATTDKKPKKRGKRGRRQGQKQQKSQAAPEGSETPLPEADKPDTTSTAALMGSDSAPLNVPDSGTGYKSAEQVYEVSPDGSRDYTTIQEAIAAATDPDVQKVIFIHPGTYDLPDETGLLIDVPNTHIKGANRESVIIRGSVYMNNLTVATLAIKADNCTVRNVTLQNTAKPSWPKFNSHATALMVGEAHPDVSTAAQTGFVANNIKAIGRTDPSIGDSWAYDVIWVNQNVIDGLISNSEIFGFSDIVSVTGEVTISDCLVHNQHSTSGGIPFWVSSQPKSPYKCKLVLNNIVTRGAKAPFCYLVFGGQGKATVTMFNVNETEFVSPPPHYYVRADEPGNFGNVLNIGGSCLGTIPPITNGVKTNFLQTLHGESLYGNVPETKIPSSIARRNGANIYSGENQYNGEIAFNNKVTFSGAGGGTAEGKGAPSIRNEDTEMMVVSSEGTKIGANGTAMSQVASHVVTPSWSQSQGVNAGEVVFSRHTVPGVQYGDALIATPIFNWPVTFSAIAASPGESESQVVLSFVAAAGTSNAKPPVGDIRVTALRF